MKLKFYILFIISTAPLWVIFQNELTHKIKTKSLKGAVEVAQDLSFSISNWLDGSYQSNKEKHINDAFTLRPDFIRLNNQIQYSFFNKVHARDVLIGKDEVMFERGYIDSYNGNDFIGENQIKQNVEKLKELQDTLNAHGKLLLTIIAADKAYFFPDKFPDSLTIKSIKKRNYEPFKTEFEKQKINYVNYNEWLLNERVKCKFPLYTRHGIHWSLFAGTLVADSLNKLIEKQLHVDIPNVVVLDTTIKNEEGTDKDLLDGLNLISGFSKDKYAYRNISYENDKGKVKPSIMVIGDSFFWTLHNLYFFSSFSKGQFWFYNNEVHSFDFKQSKTKAEMNLKTELQNHEVIVIFSRVSNLHCLGWGFIDEALNNYKVKQ